MAVSVELTGYLGKQFYIGNHFFEIAAAYAYARRESRVLFLPTRGNGTELFIYCGYFEKCLPFVRDLEGQLARYVEPAFSYNEIPSTNIPLISLSGYFQSERYFAEYANEIRTLFQPPPSISLKANQRWGHLISPEKHVLVHARRGDYLKAAAFHNPLPLKYFLNAMAEMRKYVASPTFILMSDEPEFWKNVAEDAIVVDEKDPEVALYFMSQFKHYIIANSTFSWWASYLSPFCGEGVVIAPKQWFGPSGHRDTADIYRNGMILIDQV